MSSALRLVHCPKILALDALKQSAGLAQCAFVSNAIRHSSKGRGWALLLCMSVARRHLIQQAARIASRWGASTKLSPSISYSQATAGALEQLPRAPASKVGGRMDGSPARGAAAATYGTDMKPRRAQSLLLSLAVPLGEGYPNICSCRSHVCHGSAHRPRPAAGGSGRCSASQCLALVLDHLA